jgi:hypothetical protein
VTASGGRLGLGQVAKGDIARLFAHLGIDLPPRLAAADRAAVVYARDRRGRAVIVLFEKGCAFAALRLPAAVALGALSRLTGEEI